MDQSTLPSVVNLCRSRSRQLLTNCWREDSFHVLSPPGLHSPSSSSFCNYNFFLQDGLAFAICISPIAAKSSWNRVQRLCLLVLQLHLRKFKQITNFVQCAIHLKHFPVLCLPHFLICQYSFATSIPSLCDHTWFLLSSRHYPPVPWDTGCWKQGKMSGKNSTETEDPTEPSL